MSRISNMFGLMIMLNVILEYYLVKHRLFNLKY